MMRSPFRDLLGRRSSAAVEFAVFVPLLLILFMGTVEVATAYRTYAKLNAVVANVANMISVSQAATTETATADGSPMTVAPPYTSFGATVQPVSLPDVCYGAALGTAPYPSAGMTLDISSITAEPNSEPNDVWEYDQQVTGGQCGTTNTVAITAAAETTALSMLDVPCDNVIIVQASLPYPGLFGLFFKSITLTQTAYIRWAIAQAQTELMLGTPTITSPANGSTQGCDSNNTAIN